MTNEEGRQFWIESVGGALAEVDPDFRVSGGVAEHGRLVADRLRKIVREAREEAEQWRRKAHQTEDVRLRDALLEREIMQRERDEAWESLEIMQRERDAAIVRAEAAEEAADVLRGECRDGEHAPWCREWRAMVARVEAAETTLSNLRALRLGDQLDEMRAERNKACE
jgi:hypothetical protein